MDRNSFVDFLIEIGFGKVIMLGSYSINTDFVGEVNSNFRAYTRLITASISDDIISISLSEINSVILSGQNLFRHQLSLFNEDDKISFINCLLPFFNNTPDKFKPYLRNTKIDSILK